MGETVTITRGADSVELRAVRDRAFVQYSEDDPAHKTKNALSFRFLVGDFVFGSADESPQDKDKITDANGKIYNVNYWEIDATNTVYIVNCIEDAISG